MRRMVTEQAHVAVAGRNGGAKARLRKLHITNFRAIASATIEFGDTLALVGQNGSGKTSILRALNAFFNFEQERAAFEQGAHQYSAAKQSVIEVSIEGLTNPTLPQSGRSNEFRARLKFKKRAVWEVQRGGRWEVDNNFHDALNAEFAFALIPIRRDHEVAHASVDGLLDSAVEAWVTANRQRDHLSPKIQALADRLRSTTLAPFERHVRSLAPLDGPFSFEIAYNAPPDYKLLLQNLEVSVREGGQLIPLSDSGSGTQSMAIFALYAYLAKLQERSYLLGLEEPEQNLHPQAQQQLMRNINAMGLQVVFTTHSPTIVDLLDHEDVVLCRRGTSSQRDLEVRVTQIGRSFFIDRGLGREVYYKFHRKKNSEFLFADLVVVTESTIDAAVIEQLLQDAGESVHDLGISMVSLDGKENLHYMYHLLDVLGISRAFVTDRDYFLKFRDGDRKTSLDSRGLPQYRPEIQTKPSCVLNQLGLSPNDLSKLVTDLVRRPAAAAKSLQRHGFFCFMWDLEIDLAQSKAAQARFYERLNIREADRNVRHLLIDKAQAIKKQEALLPVIEGLEAKSLPTSYQALRRELPQLARAARAV